MDWNFYQPPQEDGGTRHSGFQYEPPRPVIALLGTAGVGKTVFASRAIDQELQTEAPLDLIPEIQEYEFRHRTLDMDVILIDTPSFDDPNKSDHVLLGEFFEYVQNLTHRGLSLWGIIYFHRINDTRMYGSAQRTLQLLTTMLGTRYLRNVRLCTTMWDQVDDALGESREKQLKKKFWADLIQKGAQVEQFNGSPRSARSIIEQLVQSVLSPGNTDESHNDPPADRRPLSETEEGRLALQSFDDALQALQESLRAIQNPEPHSFGLHSDPMEERVIEGQIRIVEGLKNTFLNAGAHQNSSTEADLFSRLSLGPSGGSPHPSSSEYNIPRARPPGPSYPYISTTDHPQWDDSADPQHQEYSAFSTVQDPRKSWDNSASSQQSPRDHRRQRSFHGIDHPATDQTANLDPSRRKRPPKPQRYSSQGSDEQQTEANVNVFQPVIGTPGWS